MGRDSSLVRLIDRAANSWRIASSDPGRSVRWNTTIEVLSWPLDGGTPCRATTTNRVVLSGNVDITQAGLRLQAARTQVNYTDAGSLRIQRITATGGVTVTRGNESARGDVAVYDFNRRIITMAGNVALRRGSDTLNGGRLVMDLNSGVSSVDGRAGGSSSAVGGTDSRGGRVSGSFSVPKSN